MKYTYQISFNGSDYSDLSLTDVQMSGEWIEGTKIWRENISELKITKTENSAIYDTLEADFTDSSKFTNRIFIKILWNSVQDSLHWFGVKWGRINRETKTYVVQPLAYDFWSRYFEHVKDIDALVTQNDTFHVYDTTTNYPELGTTSGRKFIDFIKTLITNTSSWPSTDVVSSFINDDNFEDTTPVDTLYGAPVDYVTEKQSYIMHGGAYWPLKMSLNDFIDLMKMLNVYCFFDSNDKLRWEHIKFFIDKLTDNAVDFSSYIKDYDEVFSYIKTDIPILEKIEFRTESDQTDNDFLGYDIIYSELRNRPDVQAKETRSQYFTDLNYYEDNSLTFDQLLISAAPMYAYKFTNVDMVSYVSSQNQLNMTSGVGGGVATSNDFRVSTGNDVDVTVNATTMTGTLSMTIKDRSSGASISNTVDITTTGTTSDTFVMTASANDAYIELSLSASGSFTGYVLAEYNVGVNNIITTLVVPVEEGFATTNPKTNGHFSSANIFNNYWKDVGLSRSATYNGSAITFDNTSYNLIREDIRIHYSGVINPLYGFNDGTRIGMIEKWERDLDTDYYTISVIYQEDE